MTLGSVATREIHVDHGSRIFRSLHHWWVQLPSVVHFLLTGIIFVIVLGLITSYIYDRTSSRLRFKTIASRSPSWEYDAFVQLYNDRIHSDYRIDPATILRFVKDPKSSPRSSRSLIRNLKRAPQNPQHLLTCAFRRRKCVGLIKSIICANGRILFVAYIATASGEHDVATNLLSYLSKRTLDKVSSLNLIAFEVIGVPSDARGKLKLFNFWIRSRGMNLWTSEDYVQPDVDFKDMLGSTELNGVLGIATRRGSQFDEFELEIIVRAIFFEVYHPSLLAQGSHTEDVCAEYLTILHEDIIRRINLSSK